MFVLRFSQSAVLVKASAVLYKLVFQRLTALCQNNLVSVSSFPADLSKTGHKHVTQSHRKGVVCLAWQPLKTNIFPDTFLPLFENMSLKGACSHRRCSSLLQQKCPSWQNKVRQTVMLPEENTISHGLFPMAIYEGSRDYNP